MQLGSVAYASPVAYMTYMWPSLTSEPGADKIVETRFPSNLLQTLFSWVFFCLPTFSIVWRAYMYLDDGTGYRPMSIEKVKQKTDWAPLALLSQPLPILILNSKPWEGIGGGGGHSLQWPL